MALKVSMIEIIAVIAVVAAAIALIAKAIKDASPEAAAERIKTATEEYKEAADNVN